MSTIYKIVPAALWREAQSAGIFRGAPVDLADGFIHFSTAAQVTETAAKHFAGQDDLLLLRVDAGRLGDALKWEPSRGGDAVSASLRRSRSRRRSARSIRCRLDPTAAIGFRRSRAERPKDGIRA